MRLARKLALALGAAILAVMVVYTWVQVRQEVVLYEGSLRSPRGQAFLTTIQSIWRTEGEQRAYALVEEAASVLTDVTGRWVRSDGLEGDDRRPTVHAAAARAVASGEIEDAVQPNVAGELVRYRYFPMAVGQPIVLEVAEVLRRETRFIRTSRLATFGATAAIVVVCGLVAMGLGVRLVGRPLRALHEQARAMEAGDYGTRPEIRQDDEIGELAREMNVLAGRLEAARQRVAEETEARIAALEQLRHSDRLITVGQMAAGIAHELGTPLSIVAARASFVASDDGASAETKGHARVVVEQLLDFARRRGAQLGVNDVQRIVAHTLELLSSIARRRGVTLERTPSDRSVLGRVDEGQMQQALTNVVLNAIQAMPNGGRVRVGVAVEQARPPADQGGVAGPYLCVTVEDDGEGIAPEHVPHVFEPFFTTKGVGEGTGLGLSVTHGIVAEHGGWMDVQSTVGQGTRFRIFLPAPTPEPVRAAS
jgi:signal transduction histidine kinase